MIVKNAIEQILVEALNPKVLDVVNESHMHSVPENSETHFKVIIVTDNFSGMRQVQRHQKIYGLLSEQLAGPVHALALHTYSPEEWENIDNVPLSPNCLGGGKRDLK